MSSTLRRALRRTEIGASSVEYAILVSLIALIILVSVALFGEKTSGLFQKTCSAVASTQGGTCP
jgi:Flp pilus assembly pilin Flp